MPARLRVTETTEYKRAGKQLTSCNERPYMAILNSSANIDERREISRNYESKITWQRSFPRIFAGLRCSFSFFLHFHLVCFFAISREIQIELNYSKIWLVSFYSNPCCIQHLYNLIVCLILVYN